MENNLPNRPPKKKTKKEEAILACIDRHRRAHHAFGFLIRGVRLWVPLRRMAEGQSEGCSAAPSEAFKVWPLVYSQGCQKDE